MDKHTPGPWQLRSTLLHPEEVRAVGDVDGCFVADCYTTSRSLEEIAANARLIAAAPDLFAACEAALADTLKPVHLQEPDIVIPALRHAIASARGGEGIGVKR